MVGWGRKLKSIDIICLSSCWDWNEILALIRIGRFWLFNPKPEICIPKSKSPQSVARNPKPGTRNSQPATRNP